MAEEPNAAGSSPFSATFQQQGKGRNKTFSGTGSISLEIPGIQQVSRDLAAVTAALNELKSSIQGMSSSFSAGPVVNTLAQISRSAQTAAQNLNNLTSAVAGANKTGTGSGRPGASAPSAPSGGGGASGASYYNSMAASAGAPKQGGAATPGSLGGLGATIGSAFGNAQSSIINSIPLIGGFAGGLMEFAGDMAMFPLRFTRERINRNRAAAYTMSGDLTPYQFQTGRSTAGMMSSLKNIPGGMYGDVNDVLNALNVGRRVGAGYGFGNDDDAGPRAGEFYRTIGQFQQITPGLGAGRVAQTVGGQLGNVQSAQAAAFYTSGSFSMLKQGGGMKSAGEWAEGIYNWLKNQRPGSKRGQDFSYGELLGQNFPGSNVNAWFDTVGVSPEMRDYWWSWALARVRTNTSGDGVFDTMRDKMDGNQAVRKAAADTVLTRNEFGLAGQMTGQYATRERSNKWFNQMMGALVNRMVPNMSKGIMGLIQYLPDEVEQFLFNLLETSGPLSQIVGGGIANIGFASGVVDATSPGGFGDPGDIGEAGYGSYGGTGLAGLNPDVRAKIARMMKANPRLKITSGLRDGYTAAKLNRKGTGNFGSGTPYIGDVGDGRRTNRHSPHSAGWAADIGPRSEYGWLMQNAHRFGLETAASHGEPWHVQNAGTLSGFGGPMGRSRIGDPGGDIGIPGADLAGDIVGGIGGAVGGVLGNIPGLGFLGDAVDGIKMLASVLGTVFTALGRLKEMATGGGLLDLAGAGPDKVVGKVTEYLNLMGLGNASQNPADVVIQDNPAFGAGLPTSIELSNAAKGTLESRESILTKIFGSGSSSGGGGGGFGAGGPAAPADVQRVLQKYAGNNSVQAKSADSATSAKIRSVLQVASAAGLSGDELIAAVALAGRESSFNPQAFNGNAGTGDKSYGLWQINMLGSLGPYRRRALGISRDEELFQPEVNARAMKMLFDDRSTPFYHWGPYKGEAPLHGGAEDWVPAVYQVAQASGMVGDPGMDYQAAGGGSTNTQKIQFNNTFYLNGGSSGVDIGRLVPIMADRLESEMKKRLAVYR